MGYSKECLRSTLLALREKGIDGVLIGSTVYQLLLGWKELEDDVDIFSTSLSPSFDEDLILEAAEELSCFTGQTAWGTPQLRCMVEGCEIIIELYENLYDFYIPEEIIASHQEVNIRGVTVKILRIEDYLLLKAKAGREKDLEDLKFLSDLIRSGDLKIRRDILLTHAELFEESDKKLIIKRLRESSILR